MISCFSYANGCVMLIHSIRFWAHMTYSLKTTLIIAFQFWYFKSTAKQGKIRSFDLLLFFKLNFNQLKHFERLVLFNESHRGRTSTICTSESVFLYFYIIFTQIIIVSKLILRILRQSLTGWSHCVNMFKQTLKKNLF